MTRYLSCVPGANLRYAGSWAILNDQNAGPSMRWHSIATVRPATSRLTISRQPAAAIPSHMRRKNAASGVVLARAVPRSAFQPAFSIARN